MSLSARPGRRQTPDRPPVFSQRASSTDRHAAVDRLAHVVDGERGDRAGGERLHLDAGPVDGVDLGLDLDVVAPRCRKFTNTDPTSSGWHSGSMFDGLLGRLDAGHPGHREHVALGDGPGGDLRGRRPAPCAPGSGRRPAGGSDPWRDVDHPGAAERVEMRELGGHPRQSTGAGSLAADLAHRSGGAHEVDRADAVARPLRPDRGLDRVGQLVVGCRRRAASPAGRSRRARRGRSGTCPRRSGAPGRSSRRTAR